MRALPDILKRRPEAQVLIIGGDDVSYGLPPARRRTWKRALLDEVGDRLDLGRVHFLGRVPYDAYIGALQLSRVHVYLTYPFVLSWSMLEAMSCGAYLVASDTAPVSDVVRDGENGVLVGFFDREALVEAVCRGLADVARADPVRRAARDSIVSGYDLETKCLPAALSLVNASIT
jgi:glycosyltransferase involved in cell wall biosynthesis